MATPLPPFGIRNLRQSQEPYSVLQVDEAQYQSAIATDPAAALTYIDEDDGENIIVGSSLELKQRLEDPVPQAAPRIQYYNPVNSKQESQYIHLFDIQNTRSSQSIWNQQHASYINTQDLIAKRSSCADSIVSLLDHSAPRHGLDKPEDKSQSRPQTQNSAQLSAVLSEAVPDLVDNLASLLQITSETLRKAAEKTREANTSPIEDVLTGLGGVITEIGNFGLSLLETVETRTEETPASEILERSRPSDMSSVPSRLSFVDNRDNTSGSSPKWCADCGCFVVNRGNTAGATLNIGNEATTQAASTQTITSSKPESSAFKDDMCHFCDTFKLQCRKSPNSTMACTNCVTLARPCARKPELVDTFLDPPEGEDNPAEMSMRNSGLGSILDQDTDDADFSRRYPPLLSLRRANTVAGLRECAAGPNKTDTDIHSLSRHNSWALRFPHRPVPQVLDAETQRRKDFARRCFPGQEYSPGVGVDEAEVPRPHPSKNSRTGRATFPVGLHKSSLVSQPSAPEGSKDEEGPSPSDLAPAITATAAVVDDENVRPTETTFDGSKYKRQSPTFPLDESPASFWGRITASDRPQEHERGQEHTSKDRLTRHRSLVMQPPSLDSFRGLNRSRTVNDAPKPSSRLNRPFDPFCSGFPAPVTGTTMSTPADSKSILTEIPASTFGSERDVLTSHRAGNVQRSTSLRRPFSPVWEDHSDPNEKQDKADRINSLDQRGESSSLYSPPAHRMRSVPNFSTLRTIAPSVNSSSIRPLSTHMPAHAVPAMPVTSFAPDLLQPLPPPPPPPFWTNSPLAPVPQENTLSHVSQTQSTPVPPPPKPTAKPLPSTDPRVKACLEQLQSMGYGSDDANLKSRLHIYAEAANGDVMDAVEMIEEDKQATDRRSTEIQPSGYESHDREMDWESN